MREDFCDGGVWFIGRMAQMCGVCGARGARHTLSDASEAACATRGASCRSFDFTPSRGWFGLREKRGDEKKRLTRRVTTAETQ